MRRKPVAAMRAFLTFAAWGVCQAVCVQAAGPSAPEPVAGPAGAVAWADCAFGPVGGQESMRLLIMTVGDKVERAVVPPLGMAAADVHGLKLAGGRLAGTVVIGHAPFGNSKSVAPLAARLPLQLDLAINGADVTGTFSGTWPKGGRDPAASADVKGQVRGVWRAEQTLRAECGLPADAAWPSYVGPNQNFSTGPCAAALVEDLNQARLVWASQYVGPPESGSQRYGACVGVPPAAGGASPLVWKGRLYQFRYQASGPEYQKFLDDQLAGPRGQEWRQRMAAVGWTEADMRRRWAIHADEELISIDAATGNTLWTVTWPGEGINLYDHKCSLTNSTGVVADGKVFILGALGVVRAVDAATGRVLWRADVPGTCDFMRKFKADALQKRNVWAPTRSFCHGLNYSGGTVLAPDSIGAGGLVGLDGSSGQVLWRVPGVLGKCATPLAWTAGGKAYAIAANEGGTIACIEAATGSLAWRYAEAGDNEYSVILAGDRLLAHQLKREDRAKVAGIEDPGGTHSAPGSNYGQVACWRLTPGGPELLWRAPTDWGAPANCSVGAASGDLLSFRGKYSYYIVRAATGDRIASTHLPVPVRWDEGHMLAMPGLFILNPDSQHGVTKMFPLEARAGAEAGPIWLPPHPPATSYQAALSHAWADGRAFIRGADAIYCYDLRKPR